MKTVFKKIIDKELPAEVLYENEKVIVIKDIYPQAPIHLLIIPKKEIPGVDFIGPEDADMLKDVVFAAQKMAKKFDIKDYRLITNNGKQAGQIIFHLHFHFLAGRDLGSLG